MTEDNLDFQGDLFVFEVNREGEEDNSKEPEAGQHYSDGVSGAPGISVETSEGEGVRGEGLW